MRLLEKINQSINQSINYLPFFFQKWVKLKKYVIYQGNDTTAMNKYIRSR